MIASIIVLLLSSSSYLFIEAAGSSKHCGVPPFIDDLPKDGNQKVLSIWKDYKSGEDCTHQRRETQKIIDDLPKDVRAMTFGRVPSFLDDASANVKRMFRVIIYNKTMDRDVKKQELSSLANQILNKKQLDGFKRYLKKHERQKREFKEEINNLSPAAKKAYEELQRLQAEKNKMN